MTPIGAHTGLMTAPVYSVGTTAATGEELGSKPLAADPQEQWRRVIDEVLIEWGKSPESLADGEEGIQPPSRGVLQLACRTAMQMRDRRWLPPMRVVLDGEGGISFERRSGSLFESLNILPDLSRELLTFRDARLVERKRLP